MKFATLTAGAAALAAFAFTAHANEFEGPLKQLAQKEIRAMVSNQSVIDAVKAQNAKNAALDTGKIKELDQQWRAETSAGDKPMITAVLGNELSSYLKAQKDAGQGLFTEIFVMDNKGLNVGQSDVTSDYWQGDEAKWQKTYQVGAEAVHISDVEEDESTQTFQSQVSVSVVDPASNEVIGAVTVGVNVEMLAQ